MRDDVQMTDAQWTHGRPLRRGQAWVRKHGEDVAVFDQDSDKLFHMNRSAFAIWELCDGNTSPEEMAGAVAELTNADQERARHDVAKALADLSELGLVENSTFD